ncbi:ABC transporter substrate-binding protein [Clostridium sediminicola]|uniref:amino acid ABC transporter substrate-binding protein n=1 Tax=Clostridium sediminicola TaxID=3114879 RepID=UPI0031F272DA
MKKLITILLTLAMGTSILVGCGSNNKNNANESDKASGSAQEGDISLSRVQDLGKITVGLDDSYPPMEYRDDDNKLVGFDIDLAEAIGDKMGVEVEYVTTEFSGILLALQSSKFDMILSALSITDERKESIGFTDAYVQGGPILVTLKDSGIEKAEDLDGKVLGCQMGSTGQNAAEESLSFTKELKKYSKITEAIMDLKNERVDAVIMDAQVGGYYLAKDTDSDVFKVLDEMVNEEPMGIGLRQEDKELTESINKAIAELKEDGTLSNLSQKWFGYDAYK